MIRSIHGLLLSTSGEAQVLPFVSRLPSVEAQSADLAIEIVFQAERTLQPEDSVQIFHHGITRVFLDHDRFWLTDPQSTFCLSADGKHLRGEIDPSLVDPDETYKNGTPFIALMLAFRAHGLYHLHAGAVVAPWGESLLIAGEGGSGKTTSTLSLIACGFGFLGDDAVLITERGGPLEVLQIPKPFHVHERSLAPFPEYRPFLGERYNERHGKHVFDAAAAFGSSMRSSMPAPSMLIFPEVEDREETVLEPVTQADALGELTASSALLVVDGIGKVAEHLGLIARIAGNTRAYRARLGRDLLRDRRVLAAALASR